MEQKKEDRKKLIERIIKAVVEAVVEFYPAAATIVKNITETLNQDRENVLLPSSCGKQWLAIGDYGDGRIITRIGLSVEAVAGGCTPEAMQLAVLIEIKVIEHVPEVRERFRTVVVPVDANGRPISPPLPRGVSKPI